MHTCSHANTCTQLHIPQLLRWLKGPCLNIQIFLNSTCIAVRLNRSKVMYESLLSLRFKLHRAGLSRPFSQVLSGCSAITGLSQTNQTFSDQMLEDGQQCCHQLTDGETGPFGRYGSGSIRNGYPEYDALYIPPSWCLGTWSEKARQNNKSCEAIKCVRCTVTKAWTFAIVRSSYWTVVC